MRRSIYERDNYTCQYCGVKVEKIPIKNGEKTGPYPTNMATVDHVIPRSKGGRNTYSNLVTCCSRCNDALNDFGPRGVYRTVSSVVKMKREIIRGSLVENC